MTSSGAVADAGAGLDPDGYIAREGSLARVPDAFRPVVAAARDRVLALFGARLDSAYLYGSVPRGTARAGRSDLDLLIVLREEPTGADRAAVDALEAALDAEFGEVDGVGALLLGRARVLSSLETYDLGWFVACLCTPLLGDDLAEFLPRYRPDTVLARETNGDLALLHAAVARADRCRGGWRGRWGRRGWRGRGRRGWWGRRGRVAAVVP